STFSYELPIPGEAEIPEARCRLTAQHNAADIRVLHRAEPRAVVGNGPVAAVRRELVRESLVVRNRRPGDRFRPVGLHGSKKLQDLFVDRKVARADRDQVPVVVDETDRIVWVAGHGIDEAFRVTDSSQAVLVLRLTRS